MKVLSLLLSLATIKCVTITQTHNIEPEQPDLIGMVSSLIQVEANESDTSLGFQFVENLVGVMDRNNHSITFRQMNKYAGNFMANHGLNMSAKEIHNKTKQIFGNLDRNGDNVLTEREIIRTAADYIQYVSP